MKESTKNILTLSRKEMQKLALKRVSAISKEFTGGFKFLEDYPKSVTFFGANQFREDNPYYASARLLASRIVKELGCSICSGGGPGIMEAANRGAYEAGGNFEILTLIQTKKIAGVPLICVGSEFWNELKGFMEREQLSRGAVMPEDLNLFHIVDDHDKIIEIIKKVPVRIGMPLAKTDGKS